MGEPGHNSGEIRPLISIIMPLWDNAYKTMDNAVNSILDQWFKGKPTKIEIVFVDDNSRDRATKRKMDGWVRRLSNGQELPHITAKSVTHLQNKGVGCARNSGICNSSGKYICYLDCDDVYYPTRIASLSCGYISSDIVFQEVDLEYWDDDMKLTSNGRLTGFNMTGIIHTRELAGKRGDVFVPNLVYRVAEIAIRRLMSRAERTLTIPGISIGKVISKPTGQSRTHRMPSSGLGMSYKQTMKQY